MGNPFPLVFAPARSCRAWVSWCCLPRNNAWSPHFWDMSQVLVATVLWLLRSGDSTEARIGTSVSLGLAALVTMVAALIMTTMSSLDE